MHDFNFRLTAFNAPKRVENVYIDIYHMWKVKDLEQNLISYAYKLTDFNFSLEKS